MPVFTVIWIGQFVSSLGSSMSRFAVGVWLFERTGLAATFTTMIFFSHVPRIVLSPVAGALVDRFNRKLMMMISDLATAVATAVILFLVQTDSLAVWHLYGLVALSSAFESAQFPAYSAAITMLVDKKHYARTTAMLSLADDGSRALAPILAAVLLVAYQIDGVLLVDLASFAAALGTLLVVRIPQPPESPEGRAARGSLLQEAAYGFRFIFRTPGLLWLQMNFLVLNLVMGMSTGLRVPMVLARTGHNELILGQATSVALAGGVIGGLIMAVWGGPKRKIRGVLAGIVLVALSVAVLGLGRNLVGWAVGGFLIFFFIPLGNASAQAIWQAKTPADIQGRVFAARRVLGQITFPLAILAAGPLADRVLEPAMAEGGSLTQVFGGVVGTGPGAGMSLLMLLIAGVGLVLPFVSLAIPSVRNVEDLVADAVPPAAS